MAVANAQTVAVETMAAAVQAVVEMGLAAATARAREVVVVAETAAAPPAADADADCALACEALWQGAIRTLAGIQNHRTSTLAHPRAKSPIPTTQFVDRVTSSETIRPRSGRTEI